jgi:hypothetical protein
MNKEEVAELVEQAKKLSPSEVIVRDKDNKENTYIFVGETHYICNHAGTPKESCSVQGQLIDKISKKTKHLSLKRIVQAINEDKIINNGRGPTLVPKRDNRNVQE